MNSGFVFTTLAASFIMQATIGLRLLWLAKQTRGTAELAWGTSGVGAAISAAFRVWAFLAEDTPVETVALTAAIGVSTLQAMVFSVAAWKVFRPGSRLASGSVRAACTAIGVLFAANLISGNLLNQTAPGGMNLQSAVNATLTATVLLWALLDSIHFARKYRIQARYELHSPLTWVRMAFWAASASTYLVSFVPLVVAQWIGVELAYPPGLRTLLTLVATAFVWLAFFPTEGIKAWAIRSNTDKVTAGGAS